MSVVTASPEPQNVTLQCPQVAQEEVINLFEDLTTAKAEEDTQKETFQSQSRQSDNDNPSSNDNDSNDDNGDSDNDNYNDNDNQPYCDIARQTGQSYDSCHDRKDYDEDTLLYPCKDGSQEEDWRNCE